MHDQELRVDIGRDRRTSFTGHKGSLDYRSVKTVSDVAEECVNAYLRPYFYFNAEPSAEFSSSDIDDQTDLVDYESACATTLGEIQPAANRMLGPGSSPRIPRSFFDQFTDASLFLLTDFLQLQIDQTEIEPVFGRAFLYNVHSRSRVSETFHFDTNSDNLLGLFNGSNSDQQIDYRELTTMSKTGLFRVSKQRGADKFTGAGDSLQRNPPRSTPISTRDVESHSLVTLSEENDGFSNSESGLILSFRDSARPPVRTNGNTNSDSCFASGTFLVIRVDKVLQQGDIGDILELHNKDEKVRNLDEMILSRRVRRTTRPSPSTNSSIRCCGFQLDVVSHQIVTARNHVMFMLSKWLCLFKLAKTNSSVFSNAEIHSHYCFRYEKIMFESECSSEPMKHAGWADKRSQSVGAKHGTKVVSHSRSAELDDLLFTCTPTKDRSVLDSGDASATTSSPFVSVDLEINTFYRWEWDKSCDEELGRCLSDMHRNTLARLAVVDVATRTLAATAQHSVGQPNLRDAMPVAELLRPATLKRLKTASNLTLRVRLQATEAFNLPALLTLTGSHSAAGKSHHRLIKSLPLLSPESLPYNGSFFHTFIRPQSSGRVSSQAAIDKLLPRRQETNAPSSFCELRPIREVLELPSPQLMSPFTSYRNLLYVYPRSVSFPASRQNSSRNIAICVQLLCTDGDVTKSLPAIFGRSSCPTFVKEAFTTVLYHNRSPDLYDEIKIQLPSQVDENLYLLFTFYHVSCQFKKVESNAALDSVIGYSWLPVMHQGTLSSVDVNLLVSTMKPTPALAKLRPDLKEMSEKYHMDAFKWVDAHRELFRVSTLAISSVYPGDACVEMLLSACHPTRVLSTVLSFSENDSWIRLARCISTASIGQLIAFLVPLLDGFFRLMAVSLLYQNSTRDSDTDDRCAFGFSAVYLLSLFCERLTNSLPEWNDSNGRNRLLIGYLMGSNSVDLEKVLACHFDGLPLFGIPAVEELVDGIDPQQLRPSSSLPGEFLQVFLAPGEASDERIERVPVVAWWFIFETLIRFLIEYSPLRPGEPKALTSPSTRQRRKQSTKDTSLPDSSTLDKGTDAILNDLNSFISTFTRRLILRIGPKAESTSRADTTEYAMKLNRSLSHFLFDLMTLTPGKFILSAIVAHHRAISERIRHITSTMTISSDHWELEVLFQCKLDLLRIVCSHERYLTLTGVIPSGPSVLLDRVVVVVENGQVKCVERENFPRIIHEEESDPFGYQNVLTLILASELEACMSLNSHKLQNQATSLLWDLLHQHELNARSDSPTGGETVPVRGTFNGLDKIAMLYVVLLDIGCQLVTKVPKIHKASMPSSNSSSRFPSTLLEVGLSESGKSTFVMLPDDYSADGNPGRLTEPIQEYVCDTDAMRKWLLSLLWIMRYAPEAIIRGWLRQLTPESRMQLVCILHVIVNVFEYQVIYSTANTELLKFAEALVIHALEFDILLHGETPQKTETL
ncbi:unnamed protein product [Echinostoma caproni]|uniref:C2 DOCK-type domain-containing protein n=1 Tax=Echinostoma caproni TaxID=27848 RepID=A0A183ABW0_9TREM|nr:unnamed protein product [Echinostoma caproni]